MTQYRKPIPKNQSEITQEAIGVPFIKNEVKKTPPFLGGGIIVI